MANVHILKPAKPSFTSFTFDSYNAAQAFAQKNALLGPTKPYKHVQAIGAPLWIVSLANRAAMRSKPEYLTLRDWQPEFLGLAPHLVASD